MLSAAVLVHLFSLGFEGTVFFTAQEEAEWDAKEAAYAAFDRATELGKEK